MICPRCGSAMVGPPTALRCPECTPVELQLAPGTRASLPPPVTGDPLWAALRQLQERIAKVESAVLDLRRRLETDDERRLRQIREALTEQGLLPAGEDPRISRVPKLGDDRCKISDTQSGTPNPFLGPEGNEEPSPEAPGETR